MPASGRPFGALLTPVRGRVLPGQVLADGAVEVGHARVLAARVHHALGAVDVAVLDQRVQDLVERPVRLLDHRIDEDLWALRLLVRVVHAREALDLASPRNAFS